MNKALKEKTIAKQQLSELHAFNDKKTEEHKLFSGKTIPGERPKAIET